MDFLFPKAFLFPRAECVGSVELPILTLQATHLCGGLLSSCLCCMVVIKPTVFCFSPELPSLVISIVFVFHIIPDTVVGGRKIVIKITQDECEFIFTLSLFPSNANYICIAVFLPKLVLICILYSLNIFASLASLCPLTN